MTIPLMLGVAYAVLAALLLNLNLNSSWRQEIKLAAIGLVTLLYFAAYEGTQDLRGWAIAETPPNPFKLHWAVVEEPDKAQKTEGAIYILAQPLSELGALLASPRLYQLPFSPELAEQIDEALKEVDNGKPLEANLSYKAANPDDKEKSQKRDGQKSRPDSEGDKDRLKLEFRELPAPSLPPKSAR